MYKEEFRPQSSVAAARRFYFVRRRHSLLANERTAAQDNVSGRYETRYSSGDDKWTMNKPSTVCVLHLAVQYGYYWVPARL